MSISEVFLFMNDFKIITTNNIKRDDIKRIIKLINLKSDTNSKSF
jgi:GH35 family endo-1,4-beta-xylanase